MNKSAFLRPGVRDTFLLVCCALFGLIASFTLTIEKFHILQNPQAEPACSINPFITCTSAISSQQSEVFGIPLTLFGIVAYTALLAFSVLKPSAQQMWRAALGVAALALVGVHYLILQSIFVLHVICPWCFGVWLTTPLIATLLVSRMPAGTLPEKFASYVRHRWHVLAAWYALLFITLLVAFWDAWMTLL